MNPLHFLWKMSNVIVEEDKIYKKNNKNCAFSILIFGDLY